MGFFSDLNKLNKQAKEIDKNYDPGAQMQQATQNMAATTEFMKLQNQAAQLQTTGKQATFQLLAIRNTGMQMNFQQIVEVDVLVTIDGNPPYPATTRALADATNMAKMVPGTQLSGKADPSEPNAIFINWLAPVS